MALFSKILGGGDKEQKPEHAREFERVSVDGSTITILSTGKTYALNDISLGGFSLNTYDGSLRGNQYFQFKLNSVKDGAAHEAEGMATVVRVKNEMLAAKFPPQPRLRDFLREFVF